MARASGAKAPSRMSKPMKTAAELVALLNAELRKQDACTGVSVEGVTPVGDKKVALGQPPPSAVRVVLCRDNAHASSSRPCGCFKRYDLVSEEDL